MTHVAAHIRIFDPDPSDDLVIKRTAAIVEIEKKLRASRPIDEILQSANDLAYAAEPDGSLSDGQSQMIEAAIRESSEAFIAEGRPIEMLVCGMLGALRSLGGGGSNSGLTTVGDVFALGLWSALSFQKKRTDAKLEQLRTELMDSAYVHCMNSAAQSRERLIVPDPTFKSTEPFDAANMEGALKPFGNAILNLRANAAVDREEIDLLWWILSDWSSLLGRRLSIEKIAASAAIASGLEVGFMLRRIPAPAHRHLVLRHVPSGKSLTLSELLEAVQKDRSALASAFKADDRITQYPLVFPLANALRTGVAKNANAKVKRSIEDWATRALLEASIGHLVAHIPSVAV